MLSKLRLIKIHWYEITKMWNRLKISIQNSKFVFERFRAIFFFMIY